MLGVILLLETNEDKVSFQKLYEETYRKFLCVALGILHNQNDAEEIVHDVYVKLADNYPKYREKGCKEMLSLGIVITRNACINLIRARERHKETAIEIDDDLLGEENDPLEEVLRKENENTLYKALSNLKPQDRDILILKYYHDMSYKEIGRTLGLKEKTVDMRLYRIKAKLREVLAHECR